MSVSQVSSSVALRAIGSGLAIRLIHGGLMRKKEIEVQLLSGGSRAGVFQAMTPSVQARLGA